MSNHKYIFDRQTEAYKKAPTGTWLEKWFPKYCKHIKIRCTHGDEIIAKKFRRKVCMICGRSLKGPLPYICFFTGKPHE